MYSEFLEIHLMYSYFYIKRNISQFHNSSTNFLKMYNEIIEIIFKKEFFINFQNNPYLLNFTRKLIILLLSLRLLFSERGARQEERKR